MPEICWSAHPDDPEVHCEKPQPCYTVHTSHVAGISWPGEPRPTAKSQKAKAAEIAQKVKPSETTGPAEPTSTVPILARDGKPSDFDGEPANPEWVRESILTFKAFLTGYAQKFTMAEDVWPLLNAPEEMRQMVHVVRHALKHGWIVEVGAKRLQGKYYSKDGRLFRQNKLVPIYISRIS